jgi:PadR family transcriptional regulator PadR
MGRETFSGHLELLLLAAVSVQPLHGYAIIDSVRQKSGGELDYPEGTIYPALHRLESGGLMRSTWQEVEGRSRRVYSLTAAGKKALGGRRRQWEIYTKSVAAILEQ